MCDNTSTVVDSDSENQLEICESTCEHFELINSDDNIKNSNVVNHTSSIPYISEHNGEIIMNGEIKKNATLEDYKELIRRKNACICSIIMKNKELKKKSRSNTLNCNKKIKLMNETYQKQMEEYDNILFSFRYEIGLYHMTSYYLDAHIKKKLYILWNKNCNYNGLTTNYNNFNRDFKLYYKNHPYFMTTHNLMHFILDIHKIGYYLTNENIDVIIFNESYNGEIRSFYSEDNFILSDIRFMFKKDNNNIFKDLTYKDIELNNIKRGKKSYSIIYRNDNINIDNGIYNIINIL